VRRESRALRVGQHEMRAHDRPQQQFIVVARLQQRALLVEACQRAGDRAAVGEHLGATAQAVERLDARETHQGVLGTELELEQALHGVVAGLPRGGWIDDQQRIALAAQSPGHEQYARADVPVTGERRDAHETHVLGAGQGEQPRAGLR